MIIWGKYIDEENKLINNSDRRFRRHSYSMEYMSEELVNKKSIEKYEQDELISCITDDGSIMILPHSLNTSYRVRPVREGGERSPDLRKNPVSVLW